MINEVWKDVKGFEEYLMVSNLGRVLRKERIVKTSTGERKLPESMASQSADKNGYLLTSLSYNGKRKTFKVHRLVAIAFCDGYSELRNEVNHKDGNKSNNVYSNLEWSTRLENVHHAIEEGLITHKELKIYNFKCKNCGNDFSSPEKDRIYCTEECVKEGRRIVERPSKEELLNLIVNHPFTTISKMYNVSDNAIRKWCKSYGLPYKKKDIKKIKTG